MSVAQSMLAFPAFVPAAGAWNPAWLPCLYLASDTPHLHCVWPPAQAVTTSPCCSHSALRGTPCSQGKQNVRASFLSTC